MTKLNEITDESDRRSRFSYIEELWTTWREVRQSTLTRITNYLFVLNTGALITSLTYVATKGSSESINISIWLFSIGILCSVLHATCDYYVSEKCFSTYQSDVRKVYDNTLDWEVFINRNDTRVPCDWYMHLLGWAGGIAFFSGLIVGVLEVKY